MIWFGIIKSTVAAAAGFHWPMFLPAVVAALLMVALSGAIAASDEIPLRPRPPLVKPERTLVDPERHETRVILVKFRDDLPIRLRNGRLTDLDTGTLREARPVLDLLERATWRPMVPDVPEERLDEMRQTAQQTLGRAVADMNTYFHLFLPPEAAAIDSSRAIDALNALDIVELAEPVPLPAPLPQVPNFQPNQGYLNPATIGIDAYYSWDELGSLGAGVGIADIEYTFNPNHLDLPEVTIVGPTPQDPGFGPNHGTAVLGQLGSISNGWGTTGIAPESPLFFAGAYTNNSWNVGAAIINAANALNPGDVILVEQQMKGPNYPGGNPQYGMVPIEWWAPWYNAVVTAVGNGMIVVIAAGNGSQNLDDPIYSQGNNGHWPFLPDNDSGSIIVGAGHAPPAYGGSGVARSRMWYSNYGSRLNLQGWGERVWTTGYGSAYSGGGPNLYYTGTFGGTSSASPIVAGAAALLQSGFKSAYGVPATPPAMREVLIQTGSPQTNGSNPASQNIGPQPDVLAAAAALFPAPPSNNTCGFALNAPEGDTPFTNVAATTNGPAESLCGFAGDSQMQSDVWFRHIAQCTGTLHVQLCESSPGFDTKLAVYGATCPTAPDTALACNKDSCGQLSALSLPVAQGQVYRIRIGGHEGQQGEGVLRVFCVPNPDGCPADLTGNGSVGVPDLLELLAAWGPCPDPDDCPADLIGDGSVGLPDLVELLGQWGPCP